MAARSWMFSAGMFQGQAYGGRPRPRAHALKPVASTNDRGSRRGRSSRLCLHQSRRAAGGGRRAGGTPFVGQQPAERMHEADERRPVELRQLVGAPLSAQQSMAQRRQRSGLAGRPAQHRAFGAVVTCAAIAYSLVVHAVLGTQQVTRRQRRRSTQWACACRPHVSNVHWISQWRTLNAGSQSELLAGWHRNCC